MATIPAADEPARRPLAAALLVVSIAALAFNLRAAITSLPPVFPELETKLRLSSAAVTLLATTPVLCFGLVSGLAASLSRRLGEERVLFGALIVLSGGLLLRGALPGSMLFPGTVLASGAIAIMNVLLSSMIKRRWPARAGLLIGIYLTSLSLGAVLASLASVPLYNGSGGSVELTLGLWGLPAVAATLVWISQVRYGAAARRKAPAAAPSTAAPSAGPPLAGTSLADDVLADTPPAGTPLIGTGPAGGARARVAVHRHALAWQVTAFMGIQSLLYYAAVSWMPELFRDRGDTASTAGTLLAVMGLGNLLTSLSVPVLAHRVADQRILVAPAVVATAGGLAGCLYAPIGSAVIWMLVLGAAQGASLGLAIFFTMARAPDPVTAASLSSLAQAVGYLVAAVGPLAVGFLHTATGGWTIPVTVMLVLCCAEISMGLLAARGKVLPQGRLREHPGALDSVRARELRTALIPTYTVRDSGGKSAARTMVIFSNRLLRRPPIQFVRWRVQRSTRRTCDRMDGHRGPALRSLEVSCSC
jgi:MFS transporter, CP family, cyanate transporter